MLARRVCQHFVFQHVQGPNNAPAAVTWHDDIIQIATARRDKRIGEFLAIIICSGLLAMPDPWRPLGK